MEASYNENENYDLLYKKSAKAAKICELILNKINIDNIKESQVEIEKLNNIDSDKFLNYINEIGSKNDETEGKINKFTNLFKIVVKVILEDIQDELKEFKE